MGDAFLGIDVGTSAVKALVVDAAGAAAAIASRPLPLHVEEALGAEQDPADWWDAAREAVREALAMAPGLRVAAVGLTGQKHALLPLDAAGEPLSCAVLWADGRAAPEARALERSASGLARLTGAAPLPGYLVPKWLRWRKRDRALARRAAHLVFAKDWVRWRLTGRFATDPTEATASGLADWRTARWVPSLAARCGVPAGALPPVVGCAAVSGTVTRAAAEATGLREGTPVAGGAGDNEAGALGAGAVEPGVVAVMLGTSGTVVGSAGRVRPRAGLVVGAHALPGRSAVTGTVLSAGRALDWIRGVAFGGLGAAEVLAEAEAASPEPPLLFLPSLAGERSPVPDPDAAGAFAGLRPVHGRGHLARAVAEGVALSLAGVLDLLRRAGVPAREVRLTSGGAASPFWRALVSAAAGVPVRAAGREEGPALGAAILAAAAAGAGDARRLAARWARPGPRERPAPAEVERLRARGRALARLRTAVRGLP